MNSLRSALTTVLNGQKLSNYPGKGISNNKPDHGKSAHFSVQLLLPVVLRPGADQSALPGLVH
jgi:hypothetical protein